MFSGALIVIAIASICIKGFTYGVDFTGGRTYVVRFDKPVTAESVREAAEKEFGESVEVKQFGGESQMKITTKYKVENESSEVDSEIEAKLYEAMKGFFAEKGITLDEFTSTLDNPNGIISSDKVGPTIANDIKISCIRSPHRAVRSLRLYRSKIQWLDMGSRRCGFTRTHGYHRHRFLLPVLRNPSVQPGR